MGKEIIDIEAGNNFNFNHRLDVSIDDFIELLQKRKKVGATHMDIWCYQDEGFNIDFNMVREETDKEFRARINEETHLEQAAKALIYKMERDKYEKLKKKFDSAPPPPKR